MTGPTREEVEDDRKDSMTTCELRGPRLVGPHGGLRETLPSPTETDLADPLFEAIWQATKSWDVNVPEKYAGYCGMNGSHVMLILEPLRAALALAFAAGSRSGEDARDAARYAKLRGWMSSNVPDGWNEVERLAAIACYVGWDDFDLYLDALSECNCGLMQKHDSAMGGNDA